MACERGLIEAYAAALRDGHVPPRRAELLAQGLAAHQAHARTLGERLALEGELPPERSDDLWIGDVHDPRRLLYAEQQSHDTWHDALPDFAPDFAHGEVRIIVADHHELMRAWEELLATFALPSVTV